MVTPAQTSTFVSTAILKEFSCLIKTLLESREKFLDGQKLETPREALFKQKTKILVQSLNTHTLVVSFLKPSLID